VPRGQAGSRAPRRRQFRWRDTTAVPTLRRAMSETDTPKLLDRYEAAGEEEPYGRRGGYTSLRSPRFRGRRTVAPGLHPQERHDRRAVDTAIASYEARARGSPAGRRSGPALAAYERLRNDLAERGTRACSSSPDRIHRSAIWERCSSRSWAIGSRAVVSPPPCRKPPDASVLQRRNPRGDHSASGSEGDRPHCEMNLAASSVIRIARPSSAVAWSLLMSMRPLARITST
jgi:hypothetical protein